ncbi:MAG: hypothetical protein GHCLOJNM_02336 [bacterium]|nr:hypothetical protein [bacterium]
MRTTLDLPDEVLRRAKIAAVERGTTLREIVRQALTHELGLADEAPTPRKRTAFPIFDSKAPRSLVLGAADFSILEFEEDARRHGLGS